MIATCLHDSMWTLVESTLGIRVCYESEYILYVHSFPKSTAYCFATLLRHGRHQLPHRSHRSPGHLRHDVPLAFLQVQQFVKRVLGTARHSC